MIYLCCLSYMYLVMNIKLLFLVCLFATAFSCKKNQENIELTNNKPNDSLEIKVKDITKIKYTEYILDIRTEDAVINWSEYTKLQDVINNIKKSDFSFFIDNKKETKELLINLKQNIPLEVNTTAILARIAALETKFYKLESLFNLATTTKSERISVIKEFFIAFSNLNLQMNKKLEADTIIIEKPL